MSDSEAGKKADATDTTLREPRPGPGREAEAGAPWESGHTRSGVHPPSAPQGAPFGPPLWVQVSKIDATGNVRCLGVGKLLDHLVVGEPFRVSTRGGYALVTTPVAGLYVLGEGQVEARTSHATYRLERVAAPPGEPPERAATRGSAAVPEEGAVSDFVTAVRPARRHGDRVESTGTVALASAPEPGAGPFCAGAMVQAIRLGGLEDPDEYRSLGSGHLLDPVEVGGALRFALVDGASMVTSPVRSLERVAPGILRVSTANTVYQLELATDYATKPDDEGA